MPRVWGDDADDYKNGLMVTEKSVPDMDEDTATISVEAARNAIARGADPEKDRRDIRGLRRATRMP